MAEPRLSFVVAGWMIPEGTINAFVARNSKAFAVGQAEIVLVADRNIKLSPPHRCLVYPGQQPVFSLSKTSNFGIRRARAEIVVKTDVDIVFAETAVEHILKTVRPGKAMVCLCAMLKNAEWASKTNWKAMPVCPAGYGACFAMYKDDWSRHCGYDERLDGWGFEDTDLGKRVEKAGGLIVSAEHPIYHIVHPRRWGTRFPHKGGQNKAFCQNGGHNWADKGWGLASLP